MKKLILIGVLAFYSHLSNGQTSDNTTTVLKDSNSVVNKISEQEQKIVNQEQVENLNKENKATKRRLKQNKNGVVIGGGDKIIITRKGSKQWTIQ